MADNFSQPSGSDNDDESKLSKILMITLPIAVGVLVLATFIWWYFSPKKVTEKSTKPQSETKFSFGDEVEKINVQCVDTEGGATPMTVIGFLDELENEDIPVAKLFDPSMIQESKVILSSRPSLIGTVNEDGLPIEDNAK